MSNWIDKAKDFIKGYPDQADRSAEATSATAATNATEATSATAATPAVDEVENGVDEAPVGLDDPADREDDSLG